MGLHICILMRLTVMEHGVLSINPTRLKLIQLTLKCWYSLFWFVVFWGESGKWWIKFRTNKKDTEALLGRLEFGRAFSTTSSSSGICELTILYIQSPLRTLYKVVVLELRVLFCSIIDSVLSLILTKAHCALVTFQFFMWNLIWNGCLFPCLAKLELFYLAASLLAESVVETKPPCPEGWSPVAVLGLSAVYVETYFANAYAFCVLWANRIFGCYSTSPFKG